MENINLGINIVAMVAGVISAIVAVKAKNESRNILAKIEKIKIDLEVNNINDKGSSTQNSGDILVENKGNNHGIVSGIISGGVNKSGNNR